LSSDSNLTQVLEIAGRVARSWWTVVAGACLGLAGSVIALHHLPRTYEASTTIFVAPQQIPQDFVRSTITDDMSIRLASLREAVLSRPYLSKLVEQAFGKTASAEDLERLIQTMRSRIMVTVTESDSDSHGRSGGVFRLTYRDREPERAAQVVNTLAGFYIEQNVRFRSAQAEGTTRTLQELADDVLKQLNEQEQAVTTYTSQHLYETQTHFDANVQLLQGRQQDLSALERDLGQAQDRLQALKAQSASPTGADGVAGAAADPHAARVAQLRREYEALRARYRDDHPDVKAKKRELDDFIASGGGAPASNSPDAGAGGTATLPMTPLQVQIAAAEREAARLEGEQQRVRAEIAMYKQRIENTPRVDQRLSELSKGLEVLRERYRDYQRKVEEAKGSEKIEATQKGERFEVIERATPPALPIRPVPVFVYAIGLVAGLALFVGAVVARALLSPLVTSEAGLRLLADVPVLVGLPRLPTRETARARRMRVLGNVGASVVSAAVLIATMGYYGFGG
jgi:polysaccharide biosynthesis transport protein